MTDLGLRSLMSILLTLALWLNGFCVLAEMPAATTKILPMVTEQSVSTYIPSSVAAERGLAVNVIYPNKPRYKDGAPVVVVVPGADTANGLNFCIHAAQVGFVEVRFAFPGGGIRPFKSGGQLDARGGDSQLALKDIILFSMGQGKDYRLRTIGDLVPVKVNTKNVGLVGWSNGGNIALVTMDKFDNYLQALGWAAFYECPLGSLFYPSSLGSVNDLLPNRHYRQGSAAAGRCLIDFRKLAFEADVPRNSGLHKKLGEPDLPGVVYFDENGNKKWDESTEFAFNYSLNPGLNKQVYPPEVTAALERHKVFEKDWPATGTSLKVSESTANHSANPAPNKQVASPTEAADTLEKDKISKIEWPATIATLKESEAFFQERDGGACIPSVCSKYPQLLVTVFGSQIDHLQRQPDHPHIVLQYNAWLDNGAHWVRLNPEPIYLGQIANMSARNFVYNKPNDPLDASAIADHLEGEGMLKDYVFMEAAIAELADRKQANNLSSPLEAPIVSYSNGLSVPPLAANATGQTKSSQEANGTAKGQSKE